jgi:protocatechuate 3,4-dioxygenase beta subunit
LTGAQTLGPCYAANAALVRRNITAGATGLPMRLGFRLVSASNCQPISGATVDVWHCNQTGIYSALTAQVCTLGNNVVNETWCRGVQATDSNGLVYFDSVFPGWYSSRTVHIHFTVRVNGNISVTSQFAFHERVNEFIFRKHPLYNTRSGTRTTFNTNDNVFTSGNISSFMFTTRYKNNQLHAFKTLVIA